MLSSPIHRSVTATLLLVALTVPVAGCSTKPPVEILIVHTGDVRGRLRREPPSLGAAVVATEFRRLGRARPDLIRLDAGGFSDPTRGNADAAYAIAAMMGYDVAALGASEIALGHDVVDRLKRLVSFPLVCANVVDDAGDSIGDAPYVVLERRGVRIAIVGAVSRGAVAPAGFEVIDPRDAMTPILDELENRADLVVLLIHADVAECGRIARKFPRLALVIGGAGREPIGEPVAVGSSWVAHAGDRLHDIGRVELVWDRSRKQLVEVRGGVDRPASAPAPDVLEAVDAVTESEPRSRAVR